MKKYNIIIALLTVAVCALGFITYQQQNYIESLSQSIKKKNPSTKGLNSRMQAVEDAILDMQSDLDEIKDNIYELEQKFDAADSDLDYIFHRLNL